MFFLFLSYAAPVLILPALGWSLVGVTLRCSTDTTGAVIELGKFMGPAFRGWCGYHYFRFGQPGKNGQDMGQDYM